VRARRSGRRGQNHHFEAAAPHERRAEFDAVWTDSLCRALIHEPQLLLLDEPFGALDSFTREELWGLAQQLWLDKRPTVLLVTHDLREAAYLANRVCV
jgi:ABC-type Na+ transport system ATPase subunit NatA